jgi:hypothetical protein
MGSEEVAPAVRRLPRVARVVVDLNETHAQFGPVKCYNFIERDEVVSIAVASDGGGGPCLSVIMKSQPKSSNANTLFVYLMQKSTMKLKTCVQVFAG